MNAACRFAFACVVALAAGCAAGESMCSSDGQPAPTSLLERFINADCEACWRASQAPRARPGELALDWIVPGSQGEDAPLAAAATRDAAARLAALHVALPARTTATRRANQGQAGELRVSRGIAVNDYLGTAIEWPHPAPGRWRAWLLLVETIAAGSEGTPVERNLVRNVLQLDWRVPASHRPGDQLTEYRPMQIPEGARPARLRVVGWLQDPRGRIRAIAQSQPGCVAE